MNLLLWALQKGKPAYYSTPLDYSVCTTTLLLLYRSGVSNIFKQGPRMIKLMSDMGQQQDPAIFHCFSLLPSRGVAWAELSCCPTAA